MEIIKNSLNTYFNPKPSLEERAETEAYLPVLPERGALFKEGYLLKRSRNGGQNWRRRFFVMRLDADKLLGESGTLTYAESFSAPAKFKFDLSRGTTVSYTNEFKDAGYPICIEMKPSGDSADQRSLYLASDEKSELSSWKVALENCIAKVNGEMYDQQEAPGRFYEGVLFKTNQSADMWQSRHMVLDGNELRWYHNAGEELRGKISLLGAKIKTQKSDAMGAPTGYVFQVDAPERKLNLCCATEQEYLYWLKAIHQNLSVNLDLYIKSTSFK